MTESADHRVKPLAAAAGAADALAPYTSGPLVPMAVRVGVTGHRPGKLRSADMVALEGRIDAVLRDVERAAQAVLDDPAAGLLYDRSAGRPAMRAVSALAEGADRLVAKAALARGYELAAILPFARDVYARDFAPGASEQTDGRSLDGFAELLEAAGHGTAHSRVLELDGDAASEEAKRHAYAECGRVLVRHCDVLIAIWDGAEAAGRGGTEEVIGLALRYGLLVVHVASQPPHDVRLRASADGWWTAYGDRSLGDYLRRRLLPGAVGDGARPLARFAAEAGWRLEAETRPDYLGAGPLVLRRPIAQSCNRLAGALGRMLAGGRSKRARAAGKAETSDALLPERPGGPARDRLFAAFLRADQLAVHYAQLHRSGYLLIYFLAALALSCAVAAVYFADATLFGVGAKVPLLIAEFAALAAIVGIWALDRYMPWHARWIDYRLLAELLRPMSDLALIGATVPVSVLEERADETARESDDAHGRERSWVFAYLLSVLRWSGVASATLNEDYLQRCCRFVADGRLQDQIGYHKRTADRSRRIDGTIAWMSGALFTVTAGLVAWKLTDAALGTHLAEAVGAGLLTGVLPAVAAACFAVRAQAEFLVIARRSEAMARRLEKRRTELRRLVRTPGLTARDVAAATRRAAEAMQHEVADWVEIFEVKEAERGF